MGENSPNLVTLLRSPSQEDVCERAVYLQDVSKLERLDLDELLRFDVWRRRRRLRRVDVNGDADHKNGPHVGQPVVDIFKNIFAEKNWRS
jgi:hypothetical protein